MAELLLESGRLATVFTANIGAVLVADANLGDTAVTVDDTADFDTAGTLQIGGQVVGYTAVDDDSGLITLAAPLAAAHTIGDPLSLWDTGLNAPAVQYRAHVELPGSLDNADAVDASVRYSLIPYLELGIRDPGAGESVRLQRHGSDWVVVDVLGKQPVMQPGFDALVLADTAGGLWRIVVSTGGALSTVAYP